MLGILLGWKAPDPFVNHDFYLSVEMISYAYIKLFAHGYGGLYTRGILLNWIIYIQHNQISTFSDMIQF